MCLPAYYGSSFLLRIDTMILYCCVWSLEVVSCDHTVLVWYSWNVTPAPAGFRCGQPMACVCFQLTSQYTSGLVVCDFCRLVSLSLSLSLPPPLFPHPSSPSLLPSPLHLLSFHQVLSFHFTFLLPLSTHTKHMQRERVRIM